VFQQIKDLALSVPWLGSLLQHRFNHWSGNFCISWAQPKKKKKRKKERNCSWNLSTKETPGTGDFIGDFYSVFKEEIMLISTQTLPENGRGGSTSQIIL